MTRSGVFVPQYDEACDEIVEPVGQYEGIVIDFFLKRVSISN